MAAKKQAKEKKETKKKETVVNDAVKEIADLRKELQSLTLEHSQFKLKNTRSIFLTRKKLARLLTIQNMQRKEEVNV